MKSYAAALLFLTPALSSAPLTSQAATSPFNGTWVGDMSTATVEGKPDKYLVQNGTYTCWMCIPTLEIPADGKPHKVEGHSYYDEAAATIVSPNVIKVETTLKGKKSAQRILTVSSNGGTLTEEWTDYSGSQTGTAKFVSKRVEAGPKGSHALSGSWKQDTKNSTMSQELLTTTLEEGPNGLKMKNLTGQSYDAKFDGKEYPMVGDAAKTTVSLKKLGPHAIMEADHRQGTIADIITYQISETGDTMHVVDRDQLGGMTYSWDAKKK